MFLDNYAIISLWLLHYPMHCLCIKFQRKTNKKNNSIEHFYYVPQLQRRHAPQVVSAMWSRGACEMAHAQLLTFNPMSTHTLSPSSIPQVIDTKLLVEGNGKLLIYTNLITACNYKTWALYNRIRSQE